MWFVFDSILHNWRLWLRRSECFVHSSLIVRVDLKVISIVEQNHRQNILFINTEESGGWMNYFCYLPFDHSALFVWEVNVTRINNIAAVRGVRLKKSRDICEIKKRIWGDSSSCFASSFTLFDFELFTYTFVEYYEYESSFFVLLFNSLKLKYP